MLLYPKKEGNATTKRKTFTSNEVKKRHIDKTYKSYLIRLRQDSAVDAQIINIIEANKRNDIKPSETIREVFLDKITKEITSNLK